MTKTALVISGGGAKGAFAVGVLKFFKTNTNLKFDIVSGTSTGSLISPLVVTDDFDLLEFIYSNTQTYQIIDKGDLADRFIHENYVFDSRPLLAMIRQYITPARYMQIMKSDVELYNCSVSLQTGKIIHYSNKDRGLFKGDPDYEVRPMTSLDDLIWSTLASSDQPVFMPPVKIVSNGPEQNVDGGLREVMPIEITLEAGATDVWVINNNTALPVPGDPVYNDCFNVLLRTIDLFEKDVGDHDVNIPILKIQAASLINQFRGLLTGNQPLLDQFDALKKSDANPFKNVVASALHVIQPDHQLAQDGGLEFIPANMKQMMQHGYDRTQKYFHDNPQFAGALNQGVVV